MWPTDENGAMRFISTSHDKKKKTILQFTHKKHVQKYLVDENYSGARLVSFIDRFNGVI